MQPVSPDVTPTRPQPLSRALFSGMLPLTLLVASQALGDLLMRATGLPLPGPVAGALLLFVALLVYPPLYGVMEGFCRHIIKNMLVFYVPASVGIMEELPLLGAHLGAIVVTVLVSTVLVAVVSAVTFERLAPKQAP